MQCKVMPVSRMHHRVIQDFISTSCARTVLLEINVESLEHEVMQALTTCVSQHTQHLPGFPKKTARENVPL